MSAQKSGDNVQGKNRKNRSSVASRMSTSKIKSEPNVPSSLFHIQDHPLINKNFNPNSSGKEPTRRGNRINAISASLNKNIKSNLSPARGVLLSMGSLIPETVMEDLLFRFLYNIPEVEKSNKIRVSFQVEQAHWFYVDFYCSSEDGQCKKLGFREFTRQVFDKCDYLKKWKSDVENIIDEFRLYKSNVPTYGIILLDSTLNYVLLVQGYFSSKNSWGFPKGKVNEDEIPIQCAIREVLEETGFDATNKILMDKRPLQVFLNDTLVRLYIATDVPMDFKFEPHLRKEIRKISWFPIWELPKDRSDFKTSKKIGLSPNNFYTVLPFVNDIQFFVRNEQAKRQKPKVSILQKNSSNFYSPKIVGNSPNVPNLSKNSILSELFETRKNSTDISIQDSRTLENVFSPIQNTRPISFTGEGFLETFLAAKSEASSPVCSNLPSTSGIHSLKDIKHPKPIHSNLIINVYEAPPSENNSLSSSPIKSLTSTKITTLVLESSTKKNSKINTDKIFDEFCDEYKRYVSNNSPNQDFLAKKQKNLGAVGESATGLQRSKIRQKKRQQKQKNQNDQRTNEYRKGAEFYNQGISIDLGKLFGNVEKTIKSEISNQKENISNNNTKNDLLNTSSSTAINDFASSSTYVLENASNNPLIFSELQLNSDLFKYTTFTSNDATFAADSITEEFKNPCPQIELCKAWKNFKLDSTKLLV